MSRKRVLGSSIGIVLITLACFARNLSEPTLESPGSYLEGTWVPADDTLRYMQDSGYSFSSHRIQFKQDGTFEAVNIPAAWLFPNEPGKQRLFSGDGTWAMPEQLAPDMGSVQPVVELASESGEHATIRFGKILDQLYFFPGNISTDINRIRFEKCFPALHWTDPVLEPQVAALNESRRIALGFSPFTSKDRIEIDWAVDGGDMALDVYNDASTHYVVFRRPNGRYTWVYEQEIFTGPDKWMSSDGAMNEESVVVQYQTEAYNGGPLNTLTVDYFGRHRIFSTTSMSEVAPMLAEWREWGMSEPPSWISLCP